MNRTRLEKVASDNGFDLPQGDAAGWLEFASSQVPLRIWIATFADLPLVAFSQARVAQALGAHGSLVTSPLPAGAVAGRVVGDLPGLHALVRRAFQLARALPDEPLRAFCQRTAELPRTTEAERLVVERVGQDVFRAALLDFFEGRCAVTGLAVPELLRASHIKPWADCESDAERLDVANGLLLAPHLDLAFDRGLVTVADDGTLVVSERLDAEARAILGLDRSPRVRGLSPGHRLYLPWHRARVFRGAEAGS